MLSIDNLRTHHNTVTRQLDEIERILSSAAHDKSESDPRLVELFKQIDATAAICASQKRFYADKKFMLSRQRFPTTDNVLMVKAAALSELALMDAETLELTALAARDEGRLALLWLTVLSGAKIDLAVIEIPDQVQGLGFLKKIEGVRTRAENLLRCKAEAA